MFSVRWNIIATFYSDLCKKDAGNQSSYQWVVLRESVMSAWKHWTFSGRHSRGSYCLKLLKPCWNLGSKSRVLDGVSACWECNPYWGITDVIEEPSYTDCKGDGEGPALCSVTGLSASTLTPVYMFSHCLGEHSSPSLINKYVSVFISLLQFL